MGAAAAQRGLSEDGSLLAAEAAHLEDRLRQVEGERAAAVADAVGGLEDALSAVRGERDDLTLRVRFLEQQLNKAMAERVRTVPVDHVHVQTEPETAEVFDAGPGGFDTDTEEAAEAAEAAEAEPSAPIAAEASLTSEPSRASKAGPGPRQILVTTS